jgi:general nucleoside transport system permease protein
MDTEVLAEQQAGELVPIVASRLVRNLGASLVAILIGLGFGAIIIVAAGGEPFAAYTSLFRGAVGSRFDIGQTLEQSIPIMIIGLGLAVAFRARVWNIGAEGQFYIGALTGGLVAIYLPIDVPVILIPLSFAAAMAGGAIWAWIVGYMRAHWGVNEIVTSLLMNYPAFFLMEYLCRVPLRGGFIIQSKPVRTAAQLPDVPGFPVHLGIIVAIGLVPIVAYLMNKTPFGFRVDVFGMSPDVAEAAGVDRKKIVKRVMVVSGALAGLAGVIQVMGVQIVLNPFISRGFGFTAIIVALLGRNRPIGVLMAALFIGAMSNGGIAMQQAQNLPTSIILSVQALFVLLLLAAEMFIRKGRGT